MQATKVSENRDGSGLTVKCGKNTATFYPEKLRAPGKKLGKCIWCKEKWVTPSEFESMSLVQAKKWKQSIKFEGRPIGEWLTVNETEIESQQDRQNPSPSTTAALNVRISGANTKTTVSTQNADSGACGLNDIACSRTTGISQSLETTNITPLGSHTTPVSQLSLTSTSLCTANNHATTDMSQLFEDLEVRLSLSMKEVIADTLSCFRLKIENELKIMRNRIEHLENKIDHLEKGQPNRHQDVCRNETPPSAHREDFETRMAWLSETIEKQQQMIEKGEREKRERNIVIVGLNESTLQTEEVVNNFFQEKLNIQTSAVAQCRRLGRKNLERSQPRPILVTLESMDKKRQIMSRKKMLAGTSIYINNDLTKEQMSKEKDLRIKRRQLLELAEFKNKVIKIYNGRLWIDGSPVPEDRLTNISD